MKLILSFITLALIVGCTPKTIPLKNDYRKEPYQLETANNFETVWGKMIDMFAQKGIGIKLIDKSSGLIIAHNALAPVTREDSQGKLVDPTAWVVTSKIYEPGSRRYYYPTTASVEWNIRIKSLAENKTSINVNITNISAITTVTQTNVLLLPTTSTISTQVYSTGVFEKLIADIIK